MPIVEHDGWIYDQDLVTTFAFWASV